MQRQKWIVNDTTGGKETQYGGHKWLKGKNVHENMYMENFHFPGFVTFRHYDIFFYLLAR